MERSRAVDFLDGQLDERHDGIRRLNLNLVMIFGAGTDRNLLNRLISGRAPDGVLARDG